MGVISKRKKIYTMKTLLLYTTQIIGPKNCGIVVCRRPLHGSALVYAHYHVNSPQLGQLTRDYIS